MEPAQIMVAVPTRGCVSWQTVTRLQEIRDATPGLRPIEYVPGNLSVAQTRNRVVKRFMETTCTVLAMVDDDVVPSPSFLSMADQLYRFGVVAQPHPTVMQGHIAFSVYARNGHGYQFKQMMIGSHEADAVATGAFMVRRDILEQLGPVPFRINDDPDAEVTSDDFLFCEDVRELGHKVGYAFDGRWPADHIHTANLAHLAETYL